MPISTPSTFFNLFDVGFYLYLNYFSGTRIFTAKAAYGPPSRGSKAGELSSEATDTEKRS